MRFQPTKRPQVPQKPKSKTFPKAPPAAADSSPSQTPSTAGLGAAKPVVKSTLADWTAAGDDDVNGFYEGEKRQRGGRKRRKKNKEEYVAAQDWDDIYDPTRPNNYEEYKHSEEKIREVREWKDRLYAHRRARKPASDVDSSDDDYRPQMNSRLMGTHPFCRINISQTNLPLQATLLRHRQWTLRRKLRMLLIPSLINTTRLLPSTSNLRLRLPRAYHHQRRPQSLFLVG